MRFADVLVRLERAEFALRQLRTNFADGFPLGGNVRQFHQQTIGKLITGFAGVDVRRDHLGRACFV